MVLNSRRKGIVTACDDNYFGAMLMMYFSVQESFPIDMVVYDLGISDNLREIAARYSRLSILPLPTNKVICQIRKVTAEDAKMKKARKQLWPLWICPILIQSSPFEDFYWLDCDLVVLRNLEEMFSELENGPVFTPDTLAPDLTPNDDRLYDLAPIAGSFDCHEPRVNAGVSGWRKSRDHQVIGAYASMVQRASEDSVIRGLISWQDQGCLIWGIQWSHLQHRVRRDCYWNNPAGRSIDRAVILPPVPESLKILRNLLPETSILHWNGVPIPWSTESVLAHLSGKQE